jgi:4a-hydroxytetrahydrobiopterin dehydratase
MSDLLDENEIDDALKKCPDWDVQDSAIFRSVEFEDFEEAIEFVNTVAELAEEAQHHPEINVNYSTVTLTLTTLDEGGVTSADIEMAQRLDNLID